MNQESFHRPIGNWTARRAAAAQTDPAGFEQKIELSRDGDAANILDFGARHGLMIGATIASVSSAARESRLISPSGGEQPGEIGRRSKHPLPAGSARD